MNLPTPKKIVVIGPESTGKTTLCKQLAAHYQTLFCEEYARQYLTEKGGNYTYQDLQAIAKGQLQLEDVYFSQINPTQANPYLIIDTDMYVLKVWSEFVFNQCDISILEQIVCRKYDLYLLCNIDLPWVKDELREYPDPVPRAILYHMYQDILINQAVPWLCISGTKTRTQSAIQFIDAQWR